MEKALKHRRETAARASLREHVPGFLRIPSFGAWFCFCRWADHLHGLRPAERLPDHGAARAVARPGAVRGVARRPAGALLAPRCQSDDFAALHRADRAFAAHPGFLSRHRQSFHRTAGKRPGPRDPEDLRPGQGPDREHVVGKSLEPALAADSPEYRAISDRRFSPRPRPPSIPRPLAHRDRTLAESGEWHPGFRLPRHRHGRYRRPGCGRPQAADIALLLAAVLAAIAGSAAFSWRSQSFYRQALATAGQRENEELFRSTYELSRWRCT